MHDALRSLSEDSHTPEPLSCDARSRVFTANTNTGAFLYLYFLYLHCTRTLYDHLQLTPAAEPEVLAWTGGDAPAYPSRLPALDESDSAEGSSSETDVGSDVSSDVDSGVSSATVSTAAVAAPALPPKPPASTPLTPPVLAHGAPPLEAVAAAAAAVPGPAVVAIQPPRQQQAQQPGSAVAVAQQVTSAAVALPAVTAALAAVAPRAASPVVAATAAAASVVRAAAAPVGVGASGSAAVPSSSSMTGAETVAAAPVQSSDVSADVYSDIAMADLQQQGVVLYARRLLSAFTDWQQQLLQQSKVYTTISSTQYNLAQWRSYYSAQQHHTAVASTDYLITQLERCFAAVDELHYHQRQSDTQYQAKFLRHWSYAVHDAARTAQAKLQKVKPA
jgi:hypothetical protein